MKVYYICECCGELFGESTDRVVRLNLTEKDEEDIIHYVYPQAWIIKTMCEDCSVELGRTDDGFTGWISGVNVFRHSLGFKVSIQKLRVYST